MSNKWQIGGLVVAAAGLGVYLVVAEKKSNPAETVQADPVKDLRGYGSHQQPAGTWSDDSSLLLCATDSLLRRAGPQCC